MKIAGLLLPLLLLTAGLDAQHPLNSKTTLVNGFDHTIAGDNFYYHSSVPVARESLLIRATDGRSSMEWATSPVPLAVNTESITFGWLAGIGSSPGFASFGLAVNGLLKFTFHADGSDQWNLKAEDGSTLWFSKDMTDQHGDRFGFMFLTIPLRHLKKGEPVTIKVTGSGAGKTTWYMTFRFPLTNGITFKALPALTNDAGSPHQLGIAGILHFGPPAKAKIYINKKLVKTANLSFGYNHIRVQLPAVKEKTNLQYRLDVAGKQWVGDLELNPVKQWRVNFVQHSHTDIGYTRPQTELLAEHLRYIDYALDYCDNTDHYPDYAKFRWTCEASWAVDEYLRCRPASQINRLKRRVAEGRIEITGMYLNFDELPDEQILAASLQPLARIREAGLEVKTAMQNDVNGIGWSLCDHFSEMGVQYLNMGTHGHRALICFDKPTLFRWESPSGNRMLAFRAEHYMTGNTVFKIHSGDFNVFEDELLTYLTVLEGKGYSYDLIPIQHSGYITDNSPPSVTASEMIRQWNMKYAWPRLQTATATAFFEEMESKYGEGLPVIRGAWPDWWTDGFGASAREVATVRQAQGNLIANTAGLTMAAMQGAVLPAGVSSRIEAANAALIFYTEHTVGYHGSVREPFHKNTMEQRAMKESYAWEASRRSGMLGEEAMGLLQSFIAREKLPTLLVFNTLNWPRSGVMRVYIDHQIIPRYTAFTIADQYGNRLKAQPAEHHSDGTYWMIWVDSIPPFGFRKYTIALNPAGTFRPAMKEVKETTELENNFYKLVLNPETGAISSIFDKELNLELVDQQCEWDFGQFILEKLDNREQLESFRLDNFSREPLESVWFDGFEAGEVWNSVRFRGNTGTATKDGAFEFEIRLFNTVRRIDLAISIEKKLITDPEGIYFAFPLMLDNGKLSFDVQGGEVRAGKDQIPGSSNDWNTVQNYARLSNDRAQIIVSSNEAPLMQFGGINTGRYESGAVPASTHIYGWPMNNYWTTNFNADQHGGHSWVYSFTSTDDPSSGEATRFGWGNRMPFLTRVVPGGDTGDGVMEGSFVAGWPENLVLISAMPDPDGQGAILHLRETQGETATLTLRSGLTGESISTLNVDVTGRPIEGGTNTIKPFESKFYRIGFSR
jgi:alpha-mannosidase